MDAIFRRWEAGANVACRAGCSSCCRVNVAHLRNDFTDLERGALVERLAARAAEAGALTDEARWAARLPCALLDGAGRCSVYAVRPLRCRSFHSTDAAACRAAAEGAP